MMMTVLNRTGVVSGEGCHLRANRLREYAAGGHHQPKPDHSDCGNGAHDVLPGVYDLRSRSCEIHPAKKMPMAALAASVRMISNAVCRKQRSRIHPPDSDRHKKECQMPNEKRSVNLDPHCLITHGSQQP
jgi:hypothetical protein